VTKNGLIESVCELEGHRYIYVKRKDDGGATEYSFNGGKDWSPTMAESYYAAKEAGQLWREGQEIGEDVDRQIEARREVDDLLKRPR